MVSRHSRLTRSRRKSWRRQRLELTFTGASTCLNTSLSSRRRCKHHLEVNVSRVENGDKYASGRGGKALEDQFYEPKEYNMFSHDQKNGLRELHLKRTAAAGGVNGKRNNGGDNSNSQKRKRGPTNEEFNPTIKALMSQMAKNDDDQVLPGDDDTNQSNRTKPALTRQKSVSNKKGKGN